MQKGIIELQDGMCALVDPEDHDRVAAKNWYAITRRSRGWAERISSGNTSLPSFILGIKGTRKRMIDHKNGNIFDNRKENLRVCSNRQNVRNARKPQRPGGTSSCYKGVSWDKQHKKWRAQIMERPVQHYLGLYEEERGAALAYNRAAMELFGEFARLNEVDA